MIIFFYILKKIKKSVFEIEISIQILDGGEIQTLNQLLPNYHYIFCSTAKFDLNNNLFLDIFWSCREKRMIPIDISL